MSKTHFHHLIIATLEDMDSPPSEHNLIKNALYIESIEPKTIGDIVNFEGKDMVVVVAGSGEKKVVTEINNYIKMQNELLLTERKFFNMPIPKNQMGELMEILNDLDIDLLTE